jgi:hypothetical protein
MRIRQIALALAFLSLAACHWTPVTMDRQTPPTALRNPRTAPVPSQLHTLLAARGRG